MTPGGALAGVRVLDLTGESGRLAGKLLAEAGADVLRLRLGARGASMPGDAEARGGVLTWWYDGGTRLLPLDLERAADRETFRELARRADILIETQTPGRLAALGVDYADLQVLNPLLVHVSLTPFGRTGPRAHWQVSDLVASALGGVMAVTGTPEQPLHGYGRQAFNTGGFYAAICALAGLHVARERGRGQHIDLSLHQSVISCTEQVLMYWFFRTYPLFGDGIAKRQAALHWSGLYGVLPSRDGHVMVTPAPNTLGMLQWLVEDGVTGSLLTSPPQDTFEFLQRASEVMDMLRGWAAGKDSATLFEEGQRRHLAFGPVLTVREASENVQLRARNFFAPVDWEGPEVCVPGPMFRLSETPGAPAAAPPEADINAATALADWPQRAPAGPASPSADGPPLAGVRVLDFTWVLAGPFGTRVLGDLGADIVKLQTEERSQGLHHNEFPYFVMWNRNKRGASLNMKHARAREIFRRLIEKSDVVIDNFSAGVLDRLGVGYEQARQWNPRIIYVAMSGCGQDGPWRDYVTFAPTVHAICGLTHLTSADGRDDVGTGFSLSDHVSGLAAALAVLQALEARRRTGRGQFIDLSQYEVGAWLVGPAFIEFLNTGREPQPVGNRDVFEDFVPNNVYRCTGEDWLAITARTDAEWLELCREIADEELASDENLLTIEGRRRERERIDARLSAWAATQDAEAAMRSLQVHGVPAGKVCDARDFAERDEQLAHREWVVEVEHAALGRYQLDRFPAEFAVTALGEYVAAPIFGQHQFEVYEELLGMSMEEVAIAIGDGLFA
jgi:crotonobetainyl-CoA:carnitine CoA-transferase CaiB-like acyl-CoA transferase